MRTNQNLVFSLVSEGLWLIARVRKTKGEGLRRIGILRRMRGEGRNEFSGSGVSANSSFSTEKSKSTARPLIIRERNRNKCIKRYLIYFKTGRMGTRPHKISLCNCQRLDSRNEEGVNDRDQFVFCMKRFPAATPPVPAGIFCFSRCAALFHARVYPPRACTRNPRRANAGHVNTRERTLRRVNILLIVKRLDYEFSTVRTCDTYARCAAINLKNSTSRRIEESKLMPII